MKKEMSTEERIWDYIDGISTPEENQFVESMIATQKEWEEKYRDLLETHQLMQEHLELEEPSMRFTQNVMEEITRLYITPATKKYINKKIIWSIGGAFIVMILSFLSYGFSQVNWSEPSDGTFSNVINPPDFSRLYDNSLTNIFIMVNVVLGLVLLNMYLRRKKLSADGN